MMRAHKKRKIIKKFFTITSVLDKTRIGTLLRQRRALIFHR